MVYLFCAFSILIYHKAKHSEKKSLYKIKEFLHFLAEKKFQSPLIHFKGIFY